MLMEALVLNRALIVGDDFLGREILEQRLKKAGFAVDCVTDEESLMRDLSAGHPDVIVIQHGGRALSEDAIVARLRSTAGALAIVVISSGGTVSDCERLMRQGADRFLLFRADLERLGAVCQELSEERRAARRQNVSLTAGQARALGRAELKRRLEQLVVECRGNIAEMARRMGRDRSTVRYHLRRLGLLDSVSKRAHKPEEESAAR